MHWLRKEIDDLLRGGEFVSKETATVSERIQELAFFGRRQKNADSLKLATQVAKIAKSCKAQAAKISDEFEKKNEELRALGDGPLIGILSRSDKSKKFRKDTKKIKEEKKALAKEAYKVADIFIRKVMGRVKGLRLPFRKRLGTVGFKLIAYALGSGNKFKNQKSPLGAMNYIDGQMYGMFKSKELRELVKDRYTERPNRADLDLDVRDKLQYAEKGLKRKLKPDEENEIVRRSKGYDKKKDDDDIGLDGPMKDILF